MFQTQAPVAGFFQFWNHIQQVSSADGVSSKLVSGPWVLLNYYFQGEEWNVMLLIHLYVPVHAEMGSSPQCPWIEISLCKTKKWWDGRMSFLRLHFVYRDVHATAFKWLNQQELVYIKTEIMTALSCSVSHGNIQHLQVLIGHLVLFYVTFYWAHWSSLPVCGMRLIIPDHCVCL